MIDSNGITKSSILKMISKTKFGIYGGQFIHEIMMPAIGEFATEDLGAGKGNSVAIRFEV